MTNRLIQDGAKLVTRLEDILEELNLSAVTAQQQPLPGLVASTTTEEAMLLAALGLEPQHVDELSRRTRVPITTVMGTLAVLELKGLARLVGRMNYIRVREAPAPYAL